MKKITAFFNIIVIMLLICLPGVSVLGASELPVPTAALNPPTPAAQYLYSEHPLERNGISLHLDSLATAGSAAQNNILLVHGSSYSSHEFDINYLDYSLARSLAREGYTVWRIDIAGYGQSEAVEDGMMPDTEYASEDVHAAVEYIVQKTGCDRIDLLGWSWGTMIAGRFAGKYPEHLKKLVLYGPILSGVGYEESCEPFSHNTWESAAEDFRKNPDGTFDLEVTDPLVIELFCSSCWHYDGDSSPNGWRKDAMVPETQRLIDLDAITAPALVICGGKDPYMNFSLVEDSLNHLPEGSKLAIIPGGSHIVMLEKPYYREFQDKIVNFLKKDGN